MKVVISKRYGGYRLSKAAQDYLNTNNPYAYSDDRSNPHLVKCVEELGVLADGPYASLKIVEIPDDIGWEIENYAGIETIHEVRRSWS